MEISERQMGNVNVVSLSGRLDAYSSSNVETRLDLMIESSQVCLVVNLEGLEYISSSGLRVFLAALKKVRKRDGDIKLACMQPSIRDVFDIAGFTQLFTILDSEDAAVNSFSQ